MIFYWKITEQGQNKCTGSFVEIWNLGNASAPKKNNWEENSFEFFIKASTATIYANLQQAPPVYFGLYGAQLLFDLWIGG